MSIKKNISYDGKVMHIKVTGRFDYKITRDFRRTYNEADRLNGVTYYINLNDTTYIDSSALGILLLLREFANHRGGSVIIDRPSELVSNVLKVANFDTLFAINYKNAKPASIRLVHNKKSH